VNRQSKEPDMTPVEFEAQLEALHAELAAANMAPTWKYVSEFVSRQPRTSYRPWLWKWHDVIPLLMRAGDLITPERGAERRSMEHVNPDLKPFYTTSHTIATAFQLVRAGESAPAHRHAARQVGQRLRVVLLRRLRQRRRHHRGARIGGADGVHADALGRVFGRGRARQPDHAVLGGGVDGQLRRAGDAGHGRDVDDLAALAALAELPLHGGKLVLQRVEDAHQVGVDDAAGDVGGRLRQLRHVVHDAGIVDRDVEPAEAAERQRHEVGRQRLVGDVDGEQGRLARQLRGEGREPAHVDVGEH